MRRCWIQGCIQCNEFTYPGQMALTLIVRVRKEVSYEGASNYGQATYVICRGASLTASVDVRWFTNKKLSVG